MNTSGSSPLTVSNRDARRLWLSANVLDTAPVGPLDVMALIRRLGFVQIDTIRNVTRAHHHILWSRNQNYREPMLWPLLEQRKLFEHFTHDASLIPVDILPLWHWQFKRLGQQARNSAWFKSGLAKADLQAIRERIEQEGPLSTHAFDTRTSSREMWARPPHKKALDTMWYAGELATSHRRNFVKYYDLGERVFGNRLSTQDTEQDSQARTADRLCELAMERLWIANSGEVQRFWAAVTAHDAKRWMHSASLVPVRVEMADGQWRDAFALPDIEQRLADSGGGGNRVRILNPFDPAIRDRKRLRRLFGFEYVNEMFVPETKRRWGYYVYPLLEGTRFIGRLELKANRDAGWLQISGFWPESGVSFTPSRMARLESELQRLARFVGLSEIDHDLLFQNRNVSPHTGQSEVMT